MKTALLAAAAALSLAPGFARAQAVVIDPAHIAANAVSWGKQAADMLAQLRAAEMRYRQLVATHNAIAHANDLGGIASALGGVSRTYLPEAPVVADLMGAAAGVSRGGVRSLWNQAPSLLNRARRYAPPVRDDWSEEMEAREVMTANARAIAATGMEDAQDRILKIRAMRAQLETAPDHNAVSAAHALIALEQHNLAGHDAQLRKVGLMLAAADREERQRGEQVLREHSDLHAESTAWAAGSLGAAWGGGGAVRGTSVADAGAGW